MTLHDQIKQAVLRAFEPYGQQYHHAGLIRSVVMEVETSLSPLISSLDERVAKLEYELARIGGRFT